MAGPKSTPASSSLQKRPTQPAPSLTAIQSLWKAYLSETPDRLKFIDAFLLFIMVSGVIQFLYCILVTNFPFNAFLAGYVVDFRLGNRTEILLYRFGSTIGQFVLTASLRSQVNPENKKEFKDVSPER
jgi:oligosaccharyltransferase complex subunit epsilon